MKRAEAEKLLGGYATGTLTETERKSLFAAALGHQAIFDALMDEEALRELLADPAARAQVLAALGPAEAPRVVPFWRRTGVLGAAASLLVASLAGLAYLRSPQVVPSMKQEEAKPAAVKPLAAPAEAAAPPAPARKTAPVARLKETATPVQVVEAPAPPAPAPAPQRVTASAPGAPAARVDDPARMKAQADFRRAEAQDQLAKKAEAPRPAVAVMEVVGSPAPPPVVPKAKASHGIAGLLPLVSAPTWALEALASGVTRVTVTTAPRLTPVLLKRSGATVAVLAPLAAPVVLEGQKRWQFETRLDAGDVLDLYAFAEPVADPAALPETGPVNGFRARIHPTSKNEGGGGEPRG